ncbi:MAG: ATP-binding protein [Solirubrobacteraceae bacterium]
MNKIYDRRIQPLVVEGLRFARILFLSGARQVGKTTLVGQIARMEGDTPMQLITLDDRAARQAALDDPAGFVAGLPSRAVIDEIQRAPELLLELKRIVDADPTPGRFLITGSANVLASRRVVDALPGRLDRIELWPLARSEIEAGRFNFLDELFRARVPQVAGAPVGPDAYSRYVTEGGYPEARLRPPGRLRNRWFADYISGTLERDLSTLADIRHAGELERLLRLLASQSANLVSYRKLAAQLEIDDKTVKEYVALLEQTFLVRRLPGWRPGLGAREAARAKAYMCDPGLLAYLLGADEQRVRVDDQVKGKACETLVFAELLKHRSWAQEEVRLYHYQREREDIDFVAESRAGEIVAIEVKAAASLGRSDRRSLERLRAARGSTFKAGVIVHAGARTIPLGDRLWAVPFSALWA